MEEKKEEGFKFLPRILALEEYQDLEKIMSLKDRAWFGIMFYCGLRAGEVKTLRLQDFNLHSGTLYVITEKTHRQRLIIIPDLFIPVLKEYLDYYFPDIYLFELNRGKSHKDINRFCERLKKYALQQGLYNWKILNQHSLRHSYATHLIESGVPIEYVSSLLGHVNVETTLSYYIHLCHRLKKSYVNFAFNRKVAYNPIYSRNNIFKYKNVFKPLYHRKSG